MEQSEEYDLYQTSVSQPTVSDNFRWKKRCPVLTLKCTFGYASEQLGNLHVLEPNILLLIAGNYVWVLNIETRVSRYLRSTGGRAISALAVHPSREYFAVGESGCNPDVNIFQYPSFRMVKMLRGGTGTVYTAMAFFPVDCKLLATQGGSPDFQLTIWEWEKETPLLRSKSIPQDVHRLLACAMPRGYLTTCGVSHIRVWKMAHTFTGLKLKGETGRFGVLDVFDIDSCTVLPDGKIVSSSEWGNLLLWEDGLVSTEFVRNNSTCHNGRINQVLLYDLSLFSLGKDGYVRLWNISNIMYAKPEECGGQVIIEPSLQIRIKAHADLLHMVKAIPIEDDYTWFLQERAGSIHRLSLFPDGGHSSPEVVLTTHGGPVLGCTASPCTHLVATAGIDGQVQIFNCLKEKQLASISFKLPVTSLMWLPLLADSCAASILCGFSQGHLKMISFGLPEDSNHGQVNLNESFRPHNNQVTSLAFSLDGFLLSTGSLDETVFFFTVHTSHLEPIGWVSVLGGVRYLTWTPQKFSYTGVLVACENGEVVELIFPLQKSDLEVTQTFQIKNLRIRRLSFLSVKSVIRHNEELARAKKHKKIKVLDHSDDDQEVKDSGARLAKKHKGFEDHVDQENEMNLVEISEEWKPFIPEPPSPILQVFYTSSESFFWASLGGFDAGYLYKCQFPTEANLDDYNASSKSGPVESVVVPSSDDCPISSVTFNASGLLAFFGFQNGNVRVVQLKQPFDLSDLSAFWNISVHDHRHGKITGLALAFDESFLVTSADDGNIFLFSFAGKMEKLAQETCILPKISTHHIIASHDLLSDTPSWREQKEIDLSDALLKKGEDSKSGRREILKQLKKQFKSLMSSNAKLHPHLQLSRQEMLINENLYQEMEDANEEKIDSMKTKCKWPSEKIKIALDKLCGYFKQSEDSDLATVKAFRTPHVVRSYRNVPISHEFLKTVQKDFQQMSYSSSGEEEIVTIEKETEELPKPSASDEMFDVMYKSAKHFDFIGKSKRAVLMKLNMIKRARDKRAARRQDYHNLSKEKPPPDCEAPEDIAAIENAKMTLGEWTLRTDTRVASESSLRSLNEIFLKIATQEKNIRARQQAFNAKVTKLRREMNLVLQILCILVKFVEPDPAMTPLLNILRGVTFPDLALLYDSKILEKFQKELLNRTAEDFSLAAYEEAGYQMNPRPARPAKDSAPYVYFKTLKPPFPQWVELMMSTKEIVDAAIAEVSSDSSWETASGSTSDESLLAWVMNDQNLDSRSLESLPSVPATSLEMEMEAVARIESHYYSELAKEAINNIISQFDTKHRALYEERCNLDIAIKQAELLYLTRMEEFQIGKKSLPKHEALCQALVARKQGMQKSEVVVGELALQTKAWSAEVEDADQKMNKLLINFENTMQVVSDPHLHHFFQKLFKTRRMTEKKAVRDEEEDSSEDSDEETMSCSSSFSEDEVFDTFNLKVCPTNCDPDLFQCVLSLKTLRQDLSDHLDRARKRLEECEKELDFAKRRTETVKNLLKEAHHDMYELIKEQLRQENELVVVVPIHLSHMKYCPKWSLQQQVKESLIIDMCDLQKLKKRPISLKLELAKASKERTATRGSYLRLKRELVVLKERQGTLKKECDEAIIRKFGRMLDLKDLEKCFFNPKIEHLRSHIRDERVRFGQEMMRLDNDIKKTRYKGRVLTKEQSNLYIQKAMALTDIARLETSLNKRLGSVVPPWNSRNDSTLPRDLASLQTLVRMQLEEIAWCRHEIAALEGKCLYPTYSCRQSVQEI